MMAEEIVEMFDNCERNAFMSDAYDMVETEENKANGLKACPHVTHLDLRGNFSISCALFMAARKDNRMTFNHYNICLFHKQQEKA